MLLSGRLSFGESGLSSFEPRMGGGGRGDISRVSVLSVAPTLGRAACGHFHSLGSGCVLACLEAGTGLALGLLVSGEKEHVIEREGRRVTVAAHRLRIYSPPHSRLNLLLGGLLLREVLVQAVVLLLASEESATRRVVLLLLVVVVLAVVDAVSSGACTKRTSACTYASAGTSTSTSTNALVLCGSVVRRRSWHYTWGSSSVGAASQTVVASGGRVVNTGSAAVRGGGDGASCKQD